MKTMKAIKRIGCGDWHKGWGFGVHNKIGKLEIITEPDCPVNFLWKGHSQGRHGQVWNKGARARFLVVLEGNLKLTECKGSYPIHSEILKAANILLRENGLHELPENATIR